MKQVFYFSIVLFLGFNLGIVVNHTNNCTKTQFDKGVIYGLVLVKNSKVKIINNSNAVIEIDSSLTIPVKIYAK